jgi:hypothetical protein
MAAIKYLVDLDLTKNQLLNAVVQNLAVAPNNPKDGQIYWDTADKTLYVWKAYDPVPASAPFGEWVDLGSSGITNLDYIASETNGSVTSSTGNNATIPLATLVSGTNKAGLLSPAEKTKLGGVLDLGSGSIITTGERSGLHAAVTLDAVVDTTAQAASLLGQQLTLKKATTSTDGVMSSEDKTKLDTVATNAQQNVATNLAAGTRTATTFPVTNSNGTGVTIPEASITEAGLLNAADKVKVNNAVLTTQSVITASFLSLSASLAENSDEKIASQKATKSYVDSLVLSYGALVFQDGYDASTDTPKLDSTPFATGIKRGWTYAVSAAGDFFTEAVEAGDLLIARQDSPTTRAHWVVINKNIPDVLSTLLVGFVVGANSTITSADSILVAFGKVQAQLNNKEGGITAGTTSQYFRGDKTFQTLNTTVVPEGSNLYYTDVRVRATPLTGLSTATATPIVAADTVLIASGKLQGQINTKVSGSGTTNKIAKFTASGVVGDSGITELANGNVGISQANPTEKLHVSNGDMLVNQNVAKISIGQQGSTGDAHFGASGIGSPTFGNQDYGFYSAHNAYRSSNGSWKHSRTDSISAVRILGSGTGAGGNAGFSFDHSLNNGSNDINWTNLMQLSNQGNLGINQKIPTEKLDVVGNGKFSGTVSSADGTVATHLVTKGQLDTKSNDTDVVKLAGAQTITGAKTMTGANVLNGTLGANTPAAAAVTVLTSTIPQGTSPLVVTSTTKVNNLNADLLDGFNSTDFYSSTNPSSFTGKLVSISSSTSLVSTFAIAHTFGTDVIATSKFVSDNSVFLCEVIMTNNLVTFNVNTPIVANSVKFIIIG